MYNEWTFTLHKQAVFFFNSQFCLFKGGVIKPSDMETLNVSLQPKHISTCYKTS